MVAIGRRAGNHRSQHAIGLVESARSRSEKSSSSFVLVLEIVPTNRGTSTHFCRFAKASRTSKSRRWHQSTDRLARTRHLPATRTLHRRLERTRTKDEDEDDSTPPRVITDFHFIRPWWLLALVPLALLTWALHRRQDSAHAWRGVIAPHLLPFLLSGQDRASRFSPLLLIAIGWFISIVAIAGPTWRREPAPFADDTAALSIVIKVTPSMTTEDVPPSRLGRATQKIHDLLIQRRGSKTALIAYAGTVHRVMPATTDGGIIDTFAQALDPKIMPSEGDAAAEALRLADETLGGGGSILWITDGIAPEQAARLAQWRKNSRTQVRLLPPLLPGAEFDALRKTAQIVNASVVRLSADDTDVSALARAAKFATAAGTESSDRWQESGYWLVPVLAALMLPFFRRGWMTPTAARG